MSHRNPPTPVPFWRVPKIQDRNHDDYQGPSTYENSLADIVKAERNLAKLEKGIHPSQK